jgi:hypothetical protein
VNSKPIVELQTVPAALSSIRSNVLNCHRCGEVAWARVAKMDTIRAPWNVRNGPHLTHVFAQECS